MICTLLSAQPIFGMNWTCAEPGLIADLAGFAGLLAALVSLCWTFAFASGILHRAGSCLVACAAVFLALASGAPQATPEAPPASGGRIVALLDLSESLRRSGDGEFREAREVLAQRLESALSRRPLAGWEGSLIGFAAGSSSLSGTVSADRLPNAIRTSATGRPGAASELAAGLAAALNWIADGDGAGEILLLTDGWFTGLPPTAEIKRASGRGVSIHVLALGPAHVSDGLLAWDLGPEQRAGNSAVARLVTRGGGQLHWSVNGTKASPVDIPESQSIQPLRLPLTFTKRGFSHLSGVFQPVTGPARVFTSFTLVRGPARLLAYGEARWANALPPERYTVTRARPEETVMLSDFDAVAIDALAPSQFPAGFASRMLSAAAGGTGLLLINGGLRGSVEDPQRIADWEETELGPVLPVSSDPATVLAVPPPRDVMIIIDTSGSMTGTNSAGERLSDRAIQSANRVLNFLRPGDSLTILPFSSDVGGAFRSPAMNPSETSRAQGYLGRLAFGGGTNMEAAVRAAASLRGTNCDLFVIGDGGYPAGMVSTSPICRTTAIGVDGIELPGFDTRWGEQKPLRPGEQLGEITFETFEPEERLEFWRPESLSLHPVEPAEQYSLGANVDGIALAYARPESRIALIPDDIPPDPVLVFREDPVHRTLKTAAFLAPLPPQMPGETGAKILDRLTGWTQPDRFDIRLSLNSGQIGADVRTAEGWPVPAQMSASLRLADGRNSGLNMIAGTEPGTFAGSGHLDLPAKAETGILVLETGDAPAQFVPIHLPGRSGQNPASGVRREADSFGVNTPLLQEMTDTTGGHDLATPIPRFTAARAHQKPFQIWPLLASLSLLCLTAGLWCGGARR